VLGRRQDASKSAPPRSESPIRHWPSVDRTIESAIASPSPALPPCSVDRWNRSNIRPRCSTGTPGPLSLTGRVTLAPRCGDAHSATQAGEPAGVVHEDPSQPVNPVRRSADPDRSRLAGQHLKVEFPGGTERPEPLGEPWSSSATSNRTCSPTGAAGARRVAAAAGAQRRTGGARTAPRPPPRACQARRRRRRRPAVGWMTAEPAASRLSSGR
jgi:hypothetical protein